MCGDVTKSVNKRSGDNSLCPLRKPEGIMCLDAEYLTTLVYV